ncbi:MAG TPA: potassium transporter Kup [Thermoanaerobaculia bacterium]|jgi:KUP system potassium uptake protein|nr:potassium transporter Kup [Thermoanaerobaculia bacterium]
MAHEHAKRHDFRYTATLSLTALGIVYGDIGTSPLYAMRECFHGAHGIDVTRANVLGVLSLILWAIVIVVTVKYHLYVLRADNRGEGGILALMALIPPRLRGRAQKRWLLVGLGLFGAALLYGDGMITPAISVLSAVEGLGVATPFFDPYVVPITIGILVILFLFQRRGTAGVGAVFGPVMLFWFGTLALLGIVWIVREPSVLAAVNPVHAVTFFVHNGLKGFLVLGAVFLVATGGEALYADMGHFGELPIQIDWFSLVGPSLLLNYFGQGAMLLREPQASFNPFYHLAPSWTLYPLVILATMATVIASQAMISGAFSLTNQAVQLGYLPRVKVIHTSAIERGQIYIPRVNWVLMISTVGLVLGFQKSTNLAAAYGIAVSLTMVITTLLAFVVSRYVWGWKLWLAMLVTGLFLIADLAFLVANAVKIADGGWFPLTIGALVFLVMSTWKRGRSLVAERLQKGALPFTAFLTSLGRDSIHRVPGTAVFMSRDPEATPSAMLHNLKHNKVLHERVVLLSVLSEEIPEVSGPDQVRVEDLGNLGKGFYRVIARYGFMQSPGIPEILRSTAEQGLDLDLMATTFFLSRETLIPSARRGLLAWREQLFSFLSQNASRPTDYFRIPPNRVVEMGMQLRL